MNPDILINFFNNKHFLKHIYIDKSSDDDNVYARTLSGFINKVEADKYRSLMVEHMKLFEKIDLVSCDIIHSTNLINLCVVFTIKGNSKTEKLSPKVLIDEGDIKEDDDNDDESIGNSIEFKLNRQKTIKHIIMVFFFFIVLLLSVFIGFKNYSFRENKSN